MQFRNKVNIGGQPYLGLAVLLAFSIFIAGGSAWKMHETETEMHSDLAGPLAAERLVSDWASNIVSNVKRTTVLVESDDPALVSRFADDVAASSKRNTELMKKVESVLDTEEEKILFARIAENRKAYQSSRDAVFRLQAEGRGKEVYGTLAEQYRSVAKRYQDMVSEFLRLERKQLNEETHAAIEGETSDRIVGIGAIVLVFLAGAGTVWWLSARPGALRREAASAGSGDDADPAASNVVALPNSERVGIAGHVGAGSASTDSWGEFYDILA